MTGQEAKKLSSEEIVSELAKLRGQLFTMRSQTVTEKIEDNSQFGKVRRDIARLMTERRAREIAAKA
ncbi:MAG: 50S ribosomal protein L29 [Phycisphaerales bacterium]